ncbi:hypothetical protein GY50_1528 [Dehalococcoides mccartyi GY50]|nr:hypothetical protein GY50_1528 [Dehalococcoides mccartyi GY50]
MFFGGAAAPEPFIFRLKVYNIGQNPAFKPAQSTKRTGKI